MDTTIYEIDYFVVGRYQLTSAHTTRDDVRLALLGELKHCPEGFEVIIRYRGRTMKDWDRALIRSVADLRGL